jgi:hypothetical protein
MCRLFLPRGALWPSPVWLGDVAWVRRLHAVEEGTPDLGYRQSPFLTCVALIFNAFKGLKSSIQQKD